jgi:putative peptide zinc metalloprotease protein
MTEQTRKIVLPAYLMRRCEAFRIVKGDETSYLLRDKLLGRTHDFDAQQFFILEALPGVESLEKLQSVFKDRFDQALKPAMVTELFKSLVERKLLDESALSHPLLAPHARELFDVVDGKPVAKPTEPVVEAVLPPELAEPATPRPVAGQKIVLPAYLVRRVKAYRNETPEGNVYYISDDLHDRTFSFEPWQFFVLEVLPGCETLEKLQSVFQDRFGHAVTADELDMLFASLADRKLFDASALKHPLLKPFALRTFEVVDGKAVQKSQVDRLATAAGAVPAVATPPVKELPAGVQDVAGLDAEATSRMWPLFDPRPLLKVLVPVLSPLRYLAYALPVLVVMALMLVGKYGNLLVQDLNDLHTRRSLIEHVIFVLFTLNLGATLVMACIAHSYKASVERFCITLYVGFIPRFVNRIVGAERLTRKQTMALHGGNLMFRVFVFSVAVIAWYNTRDLQGSSHDFVLALVLTAGASLVLETGNPLMKGSAYFLIAAYLNEPHLRGKAYKALMNKMRAGVYQQSDSTVLSIYALLFITYAFALVAFVTWGLGQWLREHLALGGSAAILTVGLLAFLFWRNYVNLKKFGDAYERAVQFEMWRKRTLLDKGAAEGEVKTETPSYWRRAALLCLFAAMFIPYPYEATGTFNLYPTRKQVMSTDTPGLIEEVYFEGGESVKQGTILARLATQDQQSLIKVADALIEEQKAVIADLKARPRPEEVRLAEQALEVARSREKFSREKAPRLEKMFSVGAVTMEEYEAARKDHETDQMQVNEKVAALALAKTGVTKEQIAAADAKLVSLQEQRGSYVSKLDRTVLRMPFDGNILTLHLKDRLNSYLDKGQPFASVEYTGTVTAEIEVAESDVQYVKPDSMIRIRPAAYFDREFVGKVATIDRNVTAKSFGNVVKVLATIDNPDGLLKTGMTGEGKIAGPTMPVWQAFSQAILRFLRVQAWSWLP